MADDIDVDSLVAEAAGDEAQLVAVIAQLVDAQARAGLERMGRMAQLPKAARKAAKKAAYGLKSRGIGSDAPRSAPIRLAEPVDLSGVALIGSPGLASRFFIVLAEIPGAQPAAIELDAWGDAVRLGQFEHLSPGRLRHYAYEMQGETLIGKPQVVGAAVALTMIAHVTEAMRARGGAFPDGWTRVTWWCQEAQRHGASPLRAAGTDDAVRATALDTDTGSWTDFLDDALVGPLLPSQAAIDALLSQALTAADEPGELEREELDERIDGLAMVACDRFYADPDARTQAALSMRATADLFVALGRPDRAAACLHLSETLDEGTLLPHEHPVLAQSFLGIVDRDAAWQHHVEARSMSA